MLLRITTGPLHWQLSGGSSPLRKPSARGMSTSCLWVARPSLTIYSRDELWQYDPAVSQLRNERRKLTGPKPDWAFGMKVKPKTNLWRKLSVLHEFTAPEVWPRCGNAKLFAPFLIIESKSNHGSIRTGENQLANSMIKCHDILNSLNIPCFLLGILHIECFAKLYLSVSTQTYKEGRRYTNEVMPYSIGGNQG